MDVTFYNDDNLVNYDQQSSPSSVGSAGSTDIGAVPAICQNYSGGNYNKDVFLKRMNLNLSGQEQLKHHLRPIENTVIASHSSTDQHLRLNNHSSQHQGVIANTFGTLSSGYTLASPDVNMLKLGSPDLERLIAHNPHINNNGQFIQQKQHIGVTQEQEMYAQGFERELERLKSRSSSNPDITASGIQSAENVGVESSQCSVITTGVSQQQHIARQHFMQEQYYQNPSVTSSPVSVLNHNQVGGTVHHMSNPMLACLKEEPPQTVPVMTHTPPLSPIDMASQEVIKSERKRQRNRVAASKCRKRKLERISRLEDKVKSLKTQNMELSSNANILRQQVADLKSKVMAHVNSGCQLMMSQQQVNF